MRAGCCDPAGCRSPRRHQLLGSPVLACAERASGWSPERSQFHSGPLMLQHIAWRTLRDHINTSNVLDLMKLAKRLAMPVDMEAHCMRYITRAYVLLRERCKQEDLQQALGIQMMEKLEAAVLAEADRSVMKRKAQDWGRVIEPLAPDCTALQEPSVAGHRHSYHYSALVSGVLWPEDVNPTAREEHLCATEFQRVFGVTYPQYAELPGWRKRVMKQERRLF